MYHERVSQYHSIFEKDGKDVPMAVNLVKSTAEDGSMISFSAGLASSL